MTPYQLAKIVLLAGGIESRKRIQKTVHLLQAAGCDFDLDYRLHHYGPYSAELAELLDCMARDRRLIETERSTDKGPQYDYALNPQLQPSLEQYEATDDGQSERLKLERCAPLVSKLCGTRARVLELASTIVEFQQSDNDWTDAISKTADYKNEPATSPYMAQARELAELVLSKAHG